MERHAWKVRDWRMKIKAERVGWYPHYSLETRYLVSYSFNAPKRSTLLFGRAPQSVGRQSRWRTEKIVGSGGLAIPKSLITKGRGTVGIYDS